MTLRLDLGLTRAQALIQFISVKNLCTTQGKGGFNGFCGDIHKSLLFIHETNSVKHMLRVIVEKLILQETSIKSLNHRNLFLDLFALMAFSLPG